MELEPLARMGAKLAAHDVAVGMVVTLSDPAVSEMAGDIGYDFIWIDMEHAPISIETAHLHVMATRGTGCAPLVRVPWNQHGVIKTVLDLAPAGVIIPMVNSVEEAEEAVAACRYPPRGNRGCGVRRGARYGSAPFADYLAISERFPWVIVQIEHIDAVGNLDGILKVPGIDRVCVGPCDLSGSMGKLNQLDDPEVAGVLDEICGKVRAAGMTLGTAGGPLETWRARGVQWIALSSDVGGMCAQARALLGQDEKSSGKGGEHAG